MKIIKFESSIAVFENYSTFSTKELELFDAAKLACDKAYAPYSKFKVGASVLLQNQTIIYGSNQENAVYPNGLCAERVALFNAASQFPDQPIISIAITVDNKHLNYDGIVSPCGGCRQGIIEYEYKFNANIKIYLLGKNQIVYQINSVKDILPFSFSGDVLK